MPEPDAPPTTSDVPTPAKTGLGRAVKIGCAVVGAVATLSLALFLATWWLLQPGGLLHDAAGRFLARHATRSPL